MDVINEIIVKKHRVALRRYRANSLVVMGGGRQNVPCKDRLCNVCNRLGDSYHFVIECQKTGNFRHIIPRIYRDNPSFHKFLLLMNSTNKYVLKRLAKILYVNEKLC